MLNKLNNELLNQPFAAEETSDSNHLAQCQKIAQGYAFTENSIAVLSDLKANKSYIYNGRFADAIGIADNRDEKTINSIWEEEIFSKIHPDDLLNKHLLELSFFQLLRALPIEQRCDYHIASNIRMLDKSGEYLPALHRMFYLRSCSSGSLWLALCLYNHSNSTDTTKTGGHIINSATGDIVSINREKSNNLLSTREKEILTLIERGNSSNEIAGLLSISKNTVSRHRQNILLKLRVKNSFEACRVAKSMGII